MRDGHDVIVVGGGVIGLSIAREAAAHGRSVLILDRNEPGEGTSWAAAGMLAPQSEAEQDGPFFQLCLASLRMYPEWVDRLPEQMGVESHVVDSGLLFLASSEESLKTLKERSEWQRALGLSAEVLSSDDTLALEPRITMPVAGALYLQGERHITPRRLVKSLKIDCVDRGVEIRRGRRVDEIVRDGNRVAGVRAEGELIRAAYVVVAAGVWSPEIAGLLPRIPVFPKKGQILSLAMPVPAFRHIIRWGQIYAVPRREGELVIGATTEDAGFDRSLTPAGVGGLMAEAVRMSSYTAAYPILEMWSGLRPDTPDGLPLLGFAGLEGLIYATGHYRNGVLLAPITASSVVSLMEGRLPVVPLDAFRPGRFEV